MKKFLLGLGLLLVSASAFADSNFYVSNGNGQKVACTATANQGSVNCAPDINVYDVTKYGADPTGNVDSATAFNAARVDLQNANGGLFWMPCGTYKIGSNVQFTKGNLTIRGGGTGCTTLHYTAWQAGIIVADGYPSPNSILHNVEISDFSVNVDANGHSDGGNDTYGNGVNVDTVDNLYIHNVEVYNHRQQGIVSTYFKVGGVSSQNINVYENFVHDPVASNVNIQIGVEGETSHFKIVGNTLSGLGTNQLGIAVECIGCAGAINEGKGVVANNIITGSTTTGTGIWIEEYAKDVNVVDNYIENCIVGIRGSYFSAGTSNDHGIRDNTLVNYQTIGIAMFPASTEGNFANALLIGNKLRTTSTSAVGIQGIERSNVIGNKIFGGANGITSFGTTGRNLIAGNYITGTSNYSIDLGSGGTLSTFNNVTGNSVDASINVDALGINDTNLIQNNISLGATAPNASYLTFIDKKIAGGTAPPTTGTHKRGDIVFNVTAAVGQPFGWQNTADGTPGTWVALPSLNSAFGTIANNTVLGNVSGSTAPPSAVNSTQLMNLLTPIVSGKQAFNYASEFDITNPTDGATGLSVMPTLNGTEYWTASNGLTGQGATFFASNGTLTGSNVNGTFSAEGTGSIFFGTGSGIAAQVADPGLGLATTSYLKLVGGTSTSTALNVPALTVNTGAFSLTGQGTNPIWFIANGIPQLRVDDASANAPASPNYLEVNASPTIVHVECTSLVTTNVGCFYRTKGTASHVFANSQGNLLTFGNSISNTVSDSPFMHAASTTQPIWLNGGATSIAIGGLNAGNTLTLATTGTEGFIQIPQTTAVPTGIPGHLTNGGIPLVINTAANQETLYAYVNSAWKNIGNGTPSMTWATLTTLTGMTTGGRAWVTDVGQYGSLWVYSGAKWVPADGKVTIAKKSGSLATPLASVTGVTAGSFVISGGNPGIPAGMLAANSVVKVMCSIRKNGITGTEAMNVRLGTTNGTSDNLLFQSNPSAATVNVMPYVEGWVSGATTYTAQNFMIPNSTQTNVTFADRTTNFNIASANFVSFDISGANVSDSFDLISFYVEVQP